MKPNTCSRIRPSLSVSKTAKAMPTMSSIVIIADPLAAKISSAMRSLILRMCSAGCPIAAARIVGVKMPIPYVLRSCRNQGTEASMVARR